VLLNHTNVVGDSVALCLPGHGHQVAYQDLAGGTLADRGVDLLDEKRRNEVSVEGTGADHDGVRTRQGGQDLRRRAKVRVADRCAGERHRLAGD